MIPYIGAMTVPPPNSRSDAFIRVLKGLLRPLVRALIAHGVTAPVFYRLVKQAYVDVAVQDLEDGRRTVTDSTISVLTGVHRRDVKAMRSEDQTEDAALRAKVSTLSSVLGHWVADTEFTDPNGAPKNLARTGSDAPSFETLVQKVSRDIRPRTVLDELIRQNLVTLEDDNTISLKTNAFLGPADLDQRIHFFASNVGDHLAAAAENLVREDPPFLERAVFYNRLTSSSVDALEEQVRALSNSALLTLNRDANAFQAKDKDAEDGTERFRFGLFFYREDEAAPDADKDGDETP